MEVFDQDIPATRLRMRSSKMDRIYTFLKARWLIVCLMEAMIIILCLGYIKYRILPTSPQPDPNVNLTSLPRRPGSTKLFTTPVVGCNQRLIDIIYANRCYSNQSCSSLSEIVKSQDGYITQITTSQAGLRFETVRKAIVKVDCRFQACPEKTVLTIYPKETRQDIIGWGGALTDSTINNILSLSTNGTMRLLDDYFGPQGLRFNMIRVTIGGSDFSSRFYTNDDLPANKSEDLDMSSFKLTTEDLLYKIPTLKYINARYGQSEPIKLFGSMWSPPIWMKTNKHFNQGLLRGSGSDADSRRPVYKALAELKKKFLLAYEEQSIKFWGLTVMNEPIFALQPFLTFNTMIFHPQDYSLYLAEYLGPAIKDNKQLKHIKLIVHDDNRRYLMNFTDKVLESSAARKYVDGISVHGYIDEEYEMMDQIVRKHSKSSSKLFIIPTELCSGHLPFMEKALIGNWHRGVHYALDIIRSLQHSAAGWVDWNMALDTEGGPGWLGGRLDSAVIVDKKSDSYYKSPMFYVLGHFSRYIPAGSKKVESSITNNKFDYRLETVTFKLATKELVTVVLNNNPYPIEMYINQTLQAHRVEIASESITTIIH